MKKTFKKIAASVMAMVTLAVGVAGMSVSASTFVGSYATFTCSTASIQVKLTHPTSRLVTVSVTAYRKATDAYVTTSTGSNTGGDRTTASASLSTVTYPSSLYYFKMYGAVYNSTVAASGVAESWQCYAD